MVWGEGLESADAAAARAAEILSSLDGVGRATVLDADDSDATIGSLRNWTACSLRRSNGWYRWSGSPKLLPAAASLRSTARGGSFQERLSTIIEAAEGLWKCVCWSPRRWLRLFVIALSAACSRRAVYGWIWHGESRDRRFESDGGAWAPTLPISARWWASQWA